MNETPSSEQELRYIQQAEDVLTRLEEEKVKLELAIQSRDPYTMRWNCKQRLMAYMASFKGPWGLDPTLEHLRAWDGCFNARKRLQSILFRECFVGTKYEAGGGLGDIDGAVEINSRLLVFELKADGQLPRGQRLMYERMTRNGLITAFVMEWVWANEPATLTGMSVWFFGTEYTMPKPFNLFQAREWVRVWIRYSEMKPGVVSVPTDQLDDQMIGKLSERAQQAKAQPKVVADSETLNTDDLLKDFK